MCEAIRRVADVEPSGAGSGNADQSEDAPRTPAGFRADGRQAMAVLDLMLGFLDSSASGQSYQPVIKYQRPSAMPAGKPFAVLN
jgi:hypothetical protein